MSVLNENHRHNWGGGLLNSFLNYWLEEGQIKKNWGESGGKECMYIKDWFKPIFLLFLT